MNILLINHYAGSPVYGMEYRPYYLAKEWSLKGHNVTIVASSNSHVRTNQPNVKKKYTEETIDGIRYLWVKTPNYSDNGIGRIRNMFSFVWSLWINAKKLRNNYKPDVVIASSTYPLDIFPAYKISKNCGAKLFFEVHDLWPLSPIELGGYSKWHPFILMIQFAENFAYKRCDKTISMLPKTKEYMISHHLDEKKWFYIPNGIDLKSADNQVDIPLDYKLLLEKLKQEKKTIVGYTGTIGIANSLDTLIEAAKIINNDSIVFIIVGKGPEKEFLIKQIKKENINNIIFLNNVPKTSIYNLLMRFDILYIGLKNQSLFRFGISPNKLIDYILVGKPIIQSIKAGNNMVDEAKCGISIEPENPNQIVDAIDKLMKLTDSEKEVMKHNGRDYILRNHDYSVLASKFLDLMLQ